MMPTKEEDGTHVCFLEERQPPEKLSMNKSHSYDLVRDLLA